MHCSSLVLVVSSILGVAVALPPPTKSATKSEVTTVAHILISTSAAMVTTQGLGREASVTALRGVPVPVDNVSTLRDLITATVVEIGVYPPEQKWTTIHLNSASFSSKTHETGKALATLNNKPAAKGKATKVTKPKVAPTHVAPSTCTTYYPTVMRQISETFPTVMQENTANTNKAFHVAQSISFSDKVKFNRLHQYVVFSNITPGSWDCQLMVSWPGAKHGGIKITASSRRGSSATSGVSLDVYSAFYDVKAYKNGHNTNGPFSTWSSMMSAIKARGNRQVSPSGRGKGQEKIADVSASAQLTYFGTVPVNPGEYGLTINSQACPASGSDTLQFLFEIPTTDSREASVSFLGTEEKGTGVYLLANC